MSQPAKQETPEGFFQKLYSAVPKEEHSRILVLFTSFGLIILFLLFASLAPYIGRNLGLISERKEKQETFAQEQKGKPERGVPVSAVEKKPAGRSAGTAKVAELKKDDRAKEDERQKLPSVKTISAELYGKITDEDGLVLSDVTIVVANFELKKEAKTNSFGAYEILEIPPGKYSIEVNKEGFFSQKKPLVIANGESLAVNFSLKSE